MDCRRRAGSLLAAAAVLGTAVVAFAAPASAAPALCTTTLQLGSTGTCVSNLQQRLNELGLRTRLTVDGDFGNLTRNAVEAFQGRASIGVDGIVGPTTRGRLNSPGGVNLSTRTTAQIEALIRSVFPDSIEAKAIRVARCESSLNEIAIGRNTNGSRDYGVFQFNSGGTLQEYMTGTAQALNADTNVRAAYRLYQARGWQPWTCGNA